MLPILFTIESYPVFSYGVCVVLGLTMLYALALIPARRSGRRWDAMLPIVVGVGVGGVVGMRLAHILVEPYKITRLLDFYSLFQPGTSGNIIGLMIGGYLGGWAFQQRLGLPSLGNYFAPALAAASVIWRIGCTLAGCCYGTETDLPWAIHLADADRHPTMIYDGLFNLALFFLLWQLRQRITRENQLLHIYFMGYAGFRFWLEFIRVYPPIALGLTGVQWLCLAILLWQVVRFWYLRRTNQFVMANMA